MNTAVSDISLKIQKCQTADGATGKFRGFKKVNKPFFIQRMRKTTINALHYTCFVFLH